MATKEGGSEPLQCKTWVLKVSIHCEGCKKKVKRILQNVHGVYAIEIDSQQNKVTVTGNVEAETLIRKLLKSGKHAEVWPVEKKPNNQNPNPNTNNNGGKGKNKEKEKDASKSSEPGEKSASAHPEPEKKPIEPETKPNGESTESSNKEASKPDPKSETQTKPTNSADTSNKNGSNGKEKGKRVVEEAPSNEGNFVMSSGGVQPMHQVPVYPQPVYATSYYMMHPTASYSYYAPMPEMPQSYTYSSNQAMDYHPNYPQENYYGSVASSSLENQGSYDFFSEENANACSVM